MRECRTEPATCNDKSGARPDRKTRHIDLVLQRHALLTGLLGSTGRIAQTDSEAIASTTWPHRGIGGTLALQLSCGCGNANAGMPDQCHIARLKLHRYKMLQSLEVSMIRLNCRSGGCQFRSGPQPSTDRGPPSAESKSGLAAKLVRKNRLCSGHDRTLQTSRRLGSFNATAS